MTLAETGRRSGSDMLLPVCGEGAGSDSAAAYQFGPQQRRYSVLLNPVLKYVLLYTLPPTSVCKPKFTLSAINCHSLSLLSLLHGP